MPDELGVEVVVEEVTVEEDKHGVLPGFTGGRDQEGLRGQRREAGSGRHGHEVGLEVSDVEDKGSGSGSGRGRR